MKRVILACLGGYIAILCASFGEFVYAGNFELPLEESVTIEWTANDLIDIDKRFSDRAIDIGGGEELRDFIVRIAVKILIPVFVFAGIIIAIIGFYKLMGANNDEEQKRAFDYLLRGTIGIVIMVSAGFIANQLVGTEGTTNIIGSIGSSANSEAPAGAVIAEQLYTQIVFPILRIFIYFVLGVLFIMAITHAFKYIFSKDDEFQKKSFTILIYNALGIVVIIAAKSMIEAVYGKYEDVINESVRSGSGTNAGDIGNGVLEIREFGILQTAINWILSIATFIVLILIVYQAYQLLVNPSDEELVTNLKKNVGYTFIGILIIGAGYLITNFFIIT